jgi:hypothetical protein
MEYLIGYGSLFHLLYDIFMLPLTHAEAEKANLQYARYTEKMDHSW